MSRHPLMRAGAVCFALAAASPALAAPDMLSPAVGKPLQEAESALAAHNYGQATTEVNAAAAVKNKSEYETYTIAQLRAAVAAQAGDVAAASSAYDTLIASQRTPREAKLQMMMAEATMAYTARDYARAVPAIQRYLKAAGQNTEMQTLLVQSYYLQHDYAHAAQAQQAQVDAEIRAGRAPTESQLQLLATCYTQLHDQSAETHTYVQLVQYYPKPNYWAMLIHGLVVNPKIPGDLQLDVYRIRQATGVLTQPSDVMDMVEMAAQANLPQLAVNLMNEAYQRGTLGHDAGAAREAKLRSFVESRAQAARTDLPQEIASAKAQPLAGPKLTAGYNAVTFGQTDEGLALMSAAIPQSRHQDAATLHYALAQKDAGRIADAIKTLKTVGGDDGARDIAQLWVLVLQKKA